MALATRSGDSKLTNSIETQYTSEWMQANDPHALDSFLPVTVILGLNLYFLKKEAVGLPRPLPSTSPERPPPHLPYFFNGSEDFTNHVAHDDRWYLEVLHRAHAGRRCRTLGQGLAAHIFPLSKGHAEHFMHACPI